jgi:hypothetical protein
MFFSQQNENLPLLVSTSKTKEFAWFRMPKVASSSIKENLKSSINEDIKLRQRLESIDVNDSYFKFTFVRNPWDRIASCYRNKIQKRWKTRPKPSLVNKGFDFMNNNLTLKEFLILLEEGNNRFSDIHWAPQTSIVDMNKMDFIGRFESLEEDWKHVCKKIKIKHNKLPHLLKTKPENKSYRDYYLDQESIDIVSRIYADEIKRFNYKF